MRKLLCLLLFAVLIFTGCAALPEDKEADNQLQNQQDDQSTPEQESNNANGDNVNTYYHKKSETIDGWFYYEAGFAGPVIMRKNVNTGEEQELVYLNWMPADKHCAWGVDSQTQKIYYFLLKGFDEKSISVEQEGGYSCNLDGSGQKFLFAANDVVNTSVSQLLIVDGYFYFISQNGSANLYRLNLDGSNLTMIYEKVLLTPGGTNSSIWRDGNYIYFYTADSNWDNNDFRVAKYNLTSQKVEAADINESQPPWNN